MNTNYLLCIEYMSFYSEYHHKRGRDLRPDRPSKKPLFDPEWYGDASSTLYTNKWMSHVEVDSQGRFKSTYKYDIVTDPFYVAWKSEYGRGGSPEIFMKTPYYKDSQIIRSQEFHDWAMSKRSSRGRPRPFDVADFLHSYKISPEYRNLKPPAPAPADPKPSEPKDSEKTTVQIEYSTRGKLFQAWRDSLRKNGDWRSDDELFQEWINNVPKSDEDRYYEKEWLAKQQKFVDEINSGEVPEDINSRTGYYERFLDRTEDEREGWQNAKDSYGAGFQDLTPVERYKYWKEWTKRNKEPENPEKPTPQNPPKAEPTPPKSNPVKPTPQNPPKAEPTPPKSNPVKPTPQNPPQPKPQEPKKKDPVAPPPPKKKDPVAPPPPKKKDPVQPSPSQPLNPGGNKKKPPSNPTPPSNPGRPVFGETTQVFLFEGFV